MKSLSLPLAFSTIYLVIFTLVAGLEVDWSIRVALMMFSLSPLPVLWLVWRVLRDAWSPPEGPPTFYLDRPDLGPHNTHSS
jgi:hypothetical protein